MQGVGGQRSGVRAAWRESPERIGDRRGSDERGLGERPPAHHLDDGAGRRPCRGAAGRLAKGNSMRNPQRTASTAAALMIGIARP